MRYKRAFLSGLCGASLIRGFRNGFSDCKESSIAAGNAAQKAPSTLKRSIPVESLDQILGRNQVHVRLTVRSYADGQLPLQEALAFLSILVLAQPKVILEIGTFRGDTTKAMAMNLPEAIIHTVDLPLDFNPSQEGETQKDDFHLINQRKVGIEFSGTEYASRIVQHLGDTAKWDFRQAAGATFFFIDGSHTYSYCKNDSEKCFELCGGRGVFLWHDCDDQHPGILRFINEWRELGRNIVRIDNTPLCYWSSL